MSSERPADPMSGGGAAPRHADAIDVLKALAIVAVLWQHSFEAELTDDLFGNLWVRPAVPIFFVLVGLNLAGSLRRRGVALDGRSLRTYFVRRLDRIAVPFVLVLAGGYAIAIADGTFRLSPGLAFGGMPVNAPGTYFIPALIGLVLLFPFIFWAYERRPLLTAVACLAVNASFELLIIGVLPTEKVLTDWSLLYTGSPLRYLGLVILGVWIASNPRLGAPRNRPILVLAVLSAAYLVAEQLDPASFTALPDGFPRVTNLAAAPWACLLVMLALRFLPSRASELRVGRAVVEVGRASFHIYLVQMLWTGNVVVAPPPAAAPLSMLACIALGYAYYRAVPSGSALLSTLPGWDRRRALERS